jgi:hypothetical protein
MIGNWKNTDSVEKVSTKETKKEDSKIYLDS